MISIKTHNILDYVAGALLLFVPAIFGFSEIDAARNVYIATGVALLGYSLLTKYDFAIFRVIPLGVHMTLDVAGGVVLMLAPWVLGYRDLLTSGQEVVHYLAALALFAMVAFTRTVAEVNLSASFDSNAHETADYSHDRKAG